jgi:hypothetical protein
MREIKFRAYFKNRMYYSSSHEDMRDMGCIWGNSLLATFFEEFQFIEKEQYTGLKDKNAYESDIIEDNIGIGFIEYVEKYAAFRVNYKNGLAKWFYDYLDSELKCLKIIGNIHQNPELLEEK